MTTTTAPAIKKINLGGIATKKADSKTSYPTLPDPCGDVAKLTSDIVNESREVEAIKASIDIKSRELKVLAQDYFFNHHHGKHEVPSSIVCKGIDDAKLRIEFQKRCCVIRDESPIIEVLGE